MVLARYTPAQITKKSIMDVRESVIIIELQTAQTFHREKALESIFKCGDLRFEPGECAGRAASRFIFPIKNPARNLFLIFQRREIGESEEVIAFIVRACGHELLPSFVVDDPRSGIRECALVWILGSQRANRVALNHPPASETKNSV